MGNFYDIFYKSEAICWRAIMKDENQLNNEEKN